MHTPEHQPKPLAAFDLDGTLFKTSMLEAVYEQACLRRYVHEDDQAHITNLYIQWAHVHNSEETYTQHVATMVSTLLNAMTGRSTRDLDEIVAFAVENRLRTRRFVLECLRLLQSTHHIVIVSASLRNISRKVLEILAAQDERIPNIGGQVIYGSHWEIDEASKFTGQGKTINKSEVVSKLLEHENFSHRGSCAFGDTVSDLAMMQHVEFGVMVNPSSTMVLNGGHRYHTVTESKDHITHTLPDAWGSSLTYRIQEPVEILRRIGIISV